MNNPLIYLEIDLAALAHNARQFRVLAGPGIIFAAGVKANAFGHGLIPASRTFLANGADWLFVNSIEEAEQIRKAGIFAPILLAGCVQKADLKRYIALGNVRLIINNYETAQALNCLAVKVNQQIFVHVMIDTGMHREGVLSQEAEQFLAGLKSLPYLKLEGLCTHFASCDDPKLKPYFQVQLTRFNKFYQKLKNKGQIILLRHTASSAAVLLHTRPTLFNMIRPAAGLYGIYPNSQSKNFLARQGIELKEALTFKTKIAQLKWVDKGSLIGYGCTYKTLRRTRLALLPVGYYDGLDRGLANLGQVLINGKRCRILGKISMHMTTIDVTEVSDLKIEDEVVLLGRQHGQFLSAQEWADWLNTNVHEVFLGIGQRIKRNYVNEVAIG